jgi:putative acetyltransferase
LITPASAEDWRETRDIFTEYARSLAVDLCFQGFDQELAQLPGVLRAAAAGRGRLPQCV